jgi:para-aminobenzoate synthetase component I
MLNWAKRFSIFSFLDNQGYKLPHSSIECLLACGHSQSISASAGNALEQLRKFYNQHNDWIFGHLGYDLKNEIEGLHSLHADGIQFPDLFFYVPEIVLKLSERELSIGVQQGSAEEYWRQINAASSNISANRVSASIKSRFNRQEYIDTVKQLQVHILRGDCYEINFCQEFYQEQISVDPLALYYSLSKTSPNPFSAFYRLHQQYLVCASPERFLKKAGSTIFSQPIKGTIQRDHSSKERDELNKNLLRNSSKEIAENVMVVDLVRNDLSRVCKEGTVEVEELLGLYSFPQVHQLISTVKGEVLEDIHPVDIIRACFPMGSMTGAPKRRVMELIEKYERSRRGLFSGAVGYFSPDGDFDFNVVIRSIFYNAASSYLSFQVGSGITFYSDPEKEYEECLLKAQAIKKVLTG